MEITAKLNYLRIAPRKVRLIARLIRGKYAEDAKNILRFTTKRGAKPISKLLDSALANAKNNFHIEKLDLYISKITVDDGPRLKRWRARARGQAAQILKRTSHITIVLNESGENSNVSSKVKNQQKNGVVNRDDSKKVENNLKSSRSLKDNKFSGERARFRQGSGNKPPKVKKGVKRIFKRKAF